MWSNTIFMFTQPEGSEGNNIFTKHGNINEKWVQSWPFHLISRRNKDEETIIVMKFITYVILTIEEKNRLLSAKGKSRCNVVMFSVLNNKRFPKECDSLACAHSNWAVKVPHWPGTFTAHSTSQCQQTKTKKHFKQWPYSHSELHQTFGSNHAMEVHTNWWRKR